MSLIQEALKRQQREEEGRTASEPLSSATADPPVTESMPVLDSATAVRTPVSPPAPAAAPELPRPVPPPPPRRGASGRARMKMGGLAAAVIVLLVVGALVAAKWYFKLGLGRTEPTQAVQPDAAMPVAAAPATPRPDTGEAKTTEAVGPQAALPPPAPAVQEAPPVDSPAISEAPAQPEAAAMAPPAPLPVSPEAPDSRQADAAPAQPAKPPPAAPARPPPPAWPSLKLTAVLVSRNPNEGAARINNEMVEAGGEINGVTLAEIRADGVVLKYKGETKFLKVGGLLY